ncbi:unnamed protein product [marine sediment metagenome]|uniref:Uncharacterized protein n=1 Tax=marine sediment metagenome TaxID=412755 RepID=X0YWA4_9ZZZZ
MGQSGICNVASIKTQVLEGGYSSEMSQPRIRNASALTQPQVLEGG